MSFPGLYSSIHSPRLESVDLRRCHTSDDPRGGDDVPAGSDGLGVFEEELFLGIVEIRLEMGGLRIGFAGGRAVAADVDAVVFGASLEEEAFGFDGGLF